jgi:hypothetical protein
MLEHLAVIAAVAGVAVCVAVPVLLASSFFSGEE